MTHPDLQNSDLHLRPLYPRDVDVLGSWRDAGVAIPDLTSEFPNHSNRRLVHHPLAVMWQRMTAVALPSRPKWSGFVATLNDNLCGVIEVSPFNRTRSTWQVDRIVVNPASLPADTKGPLDSVGSQLLRHCFDKVWEARMWLAEVDIEQKSALALYRQNGFQPLAQVTYWEISPDALMEQAKQGADLPNLMAVNNADAQLLYQLDTAAMPPLVRQVFDQQVQDFKVEPVKGMTRTARHWMQREKRIQSYVFEPQRKAAIGRFDLTACRGKHRYHSAELTVHPAYTWLYPELLSHMAGILQGYPAMPLRVTSRDYQPEREEFLMQIQATPVERTLMLSRSVWHKVREAKPAALEGLQLPEVLAGLQPAGKPIPGRLSWQNDWDETLLKRSPSPKSFKRTEKSDTFEPPHRQKPDNLSGQSG
ncbi:GNAT family N-acetyltransferase [Oscillatoria sp. CS-180]|uniref:GNAT family N-acetyltransferase n=1 Tax=Oscillatoria sp. CS-180 TaxID=3021720 RepID=UPI00232D3325|nr:GNAT family N-acetyltransferase [Oscillatoria sp. CS-180]MDB9528614.1 GNAT family N-acetyltransferase [Oscillatoria sp. CS-180]